MTEETKPTYTPSMSASAVQAREAIAAAQHGKADTSQLLLALIIVFLFFPITIVLRLMQIMSRAQFTQFWVDYGLLPAEQSEDK